MKPAYYNEIDAYCAAWLRNLIAAGHIPAGDVDERDIREVSGDDLKGFGACHFFAGIGGWAYAGRLAGIPDAESLWTGSCPCQPLSSAGQRKGHADERHLWPAFHALIAKRRPATVLGEQVASKDGREWLAGIRADLEALGYAIGAADLPAAGIGAPQPRQRLWWVADADGRYTSTEGLQRGGEYGQRTQDGIISGGLAGSGLGFWSAFDLIPCGDGKARRVEPGTFPLAHGVPARVGKLRAYGNAIVPQVAAEFMMAAMEAV